MEAFKYSDIGSRANNEDFLGIGDFMFVICDGVGGIDKGEIASKTVGDAFIEKTSLLKKSEINATVICDLIAEVQLELNKTISDYPEYRNIGTTICAVLISDNEIFCAHIGDSRIYVIDTCNRRFWRSTDHTVATELIKSGIINESGARNHPSTNQLTRAIQAIPEKEMAEPDIYTFNNIDPEYQIFMCTDGVNEAFDDQELVEILCKRNIRSQEKLDVIQKRCKEKSRDNNSAILILPELESVHSAEKLSNSHQWTYLKEEDTPRNDIKIEREDAIHGSKNLTKRNLNRIVIYSLFVIIISVVIMIIFMPSLSK